MKICITSTGTTLDSQVDPRFGRASYFVIMDSLTGKFEAIQNAGINAMSGAGIQAAQIMATKNVEVLITGNVGPHAFQGLNASGIRIVVGAHGTVNEVVEKFKSGELKETTGPTVGGHSGMGGGMGRGSGRGQSRVL